MADGGRDPGAVVAHPELRAGGVHGAADLDGGARRGVLRGVVCQLQPRLQEAVGVAVDDARRALFDAPAVVGDDRDQLGDAAREHVQIDVAHGEAVALHGSQEVDVADQARHPVELGDAEGPSGGDVRRVGRIHQLEVSAHDRDRGLQLVSDVVEKPSLRVEEGVGALQAFRQLRDGPSIIEQEPRDHGRHDERQDRGSGEQTHSDPRRRCAGCGVQRQQRHGGESETRRDDGQQDAESARATPRASGSGSAIHPLIMNPCGGVGDQPACVIESRSSFASSCSSVSSPRST